MPFTVELLLLSWTSSTALPGPIRAQSVGEQIRWPRHTLHALSERREEGRRSSSACHARDRFPAMAIGDPEELSARATARLPPASPPPASCRAGRHSSRSCHSPWRWGGRAATCAKRKGTVKRQICPKGCERRLAIVGGSERERPAGSAWSRQRREMGGRRSGRRRGKEGSREGGAGHGMDSTGVPKVHRRRRGGMAAAAAVSGMGGDKWIEQNRGERGKREVGPTCWVEIEGLQF